VDFDWSGEQSELRRSLREFAKNELNQDLLLRDQVGQFDSNGWEKCGAMGIQGFPYSVEHGGQGATAVDTVVAMEALGYGSRDNGLLFSINAHMWAGTTPLHEFGTPEQKDRWLPGLCNGSLISGQAITEPDSGSDAFALATTIERDGSDYVLNGAKAFITNAPIADLMVVFATVDKTKGWAGLCAIVVEKGTAGMHVEAPYEKMGLRTSPMSGLVFDNCRVPAGNLIGKVGAGMVIFNHSIEWERGMILASAIGTMERTLEECVSFANSRSQFGRSIGQFQAISHRIADMKVRLENSKLLIYRLASMRDRGRATSLEAALAKYYVSEAWVQSSLDAVQIHGGAGYLQESQIERQVRDSLASRIYSGTSDIQKNVIARHLGLR
jgi:alkylation response protein AidB-like acyl-CoA dehydrogenase